MASKFANSEVDPSKAHEISRRDLLKISVALALASKLPKTETNAPITFKILRPEDMFEGVVILHDVRIGKKNLFSSKFTIKPNHPNESGLDLILPSQHLLEEAFREDSTGAFTIPKRGEVRAWFSAPTRLSFFWDQPRPIDLSPSGILSGLAILIPSFKKPGLGKPKIRESWIEPITRLLVTPANAATWLVLNEPRPTHFNPVWAIELREGEKADVSANLIWTPDLEHGKSSDEFPPDCKDCVTPLSSQDRRDLVNVFSGDSPVYPGCTVPTPQPPKFSPLILSSQGSFLKANAVHDPPPGCGDLLSWDQSTSHGRDHEAQITRKYFCYPDGIPITVIKESTRHFEAADNHEGVGAFIRIRLLVQPTEASKNSELAEMPFVSEVIPAQELPPIDLDPTAGAGGELLPNHDGWIDSDDMKEHAFWPLARGQKLKLKVSCDDHIGQPYEIYRAFILVSNSMLDPKTGRLSPARQAKVDAAWESASALADRSCDLLGQRLAVAHPGKPGDTSVTAYSLDLARAAFGPLPKSGIATRPFEPRLHRLTVSSDCLSNLAGSVRPLPVSYRRYPGLSQDEARQAPSSDKFKGVLTPDVEEIPGQPYLGLEVAIDSGIGNEQARRFGGMAQPNLQIAAVGRETELIAGNVQKYLTNTIGPQDLFAGAKLLGGIDLGKVLKLLPEQLPAWIFERSGGNPWESVASSDDTSQGAPNLAEDEEPPDRAELFVGWRATFDWSTTELKQFFLFNPTSKTALTIHSEITFEAISGKGNAQAQATLRDFEIAIPNADGPDSAWITISFEEVSVSSRTGQAPSFSPRIKDGDDAIRFGQKLSFLDALRKLLKSQKGLSIDVTGSFVAIRQTTHLDDQNFGTFSITGLTFTFGIRLPFTGEPLEAEFALGSVSNPFGLSVMGYSGSAFFETIVTTAGTKSVAISLEFGGDYAANFAGIAKGRAFLRAGMYFRKSQDDCVFRGFVRTGGHLDVLGIGGVSLLAILSLECTKAEVKGSLHVEITISIGWFNVSKSFDVSQSYQKPGESHGLASNTILEVSPNTQLLDIAYRPSAREIGDQGRGSNGTRNPSIAPGGADNRIQSVTDRMSLDEWREYCNAFVY